MVENNEIYEYTVIFTFKAEADGDTTAAECAQTTFAEMCGEFSDVIDTAKLLCNVGQDESHE